MAQNPSSAEFPANIPPPKQKKARTFKACSLCKHKRIRCEFISFDKGCQNCIKLRRDDCSLLNDQLIRSLQNKSAMADSVFVKPFVDVLSQDLRTEDKNEPILSPPPFSATTAKVSKTTKKVKKSKPIAFKLKDSVSNVTTPLFEDNIVSSLDSLRSEASKSLLQDTNLKVTKILELLVNGNTSNNPILMSSGNSSLPLTNGINSFSNGSVRLNEQFNFNSNHITLSPTKDKSTKEDSVVVVENESSSLTANTTNTILSNFNETYRQLYAPFSNLIRHISKLNTPLQIRNLHDPEPLDLETVTTSDVISDNLLTMSECVTLLREFKDNYGAWVSFPQNVSLELIIQHIRDSQCSLLLTLYMVLSLRYTLYYHDLKTRVYKKLLLKLREDYGQEFTRLGHAFKLEYIQSLVMLSVYSNSLSSDYQIFDSWIISGMGLQMLWSNGVQKSLVDSDAQAKSSLYKGRQQFFSVVGDESELNDESLSYNRLYNHLCLAHLNNCFLSGRQGILEQNDINRCKLTLQSQEASHFDGRMLAEIELYWLMERFQRNGLRDSDQITLDVQLTNFRNGEPTPELSTMNAASHSGNSKRDSELDSMLKKITKWWENWNYLSNQPIEEFIDFSYHFCYANLILMYFQQNKYIPTPKSKHPLVYYSRKRLSAKLKDKIDLEGKYYANSALASAERSKDAKVLIKQYPMVDLQLPPNKKDELTLHCVKALKLFQPVDLNHFRFLSDQLIYSIFYTAVIYLKHCNIDSDGKALVKDLSEKFRKIRKGELKSFWIEEVDLKVPSCILQYYSSLESLLRELEIKEKDSVLS